MQSSAPRVVWAPQPKQAVFMSRWEDEALYGGSAGSGKSDALLMEALRQVHIPHYRALIIRKTYPQLSELIDRSQYLYKRCYPRARYVGSEVRRWIFPSGAKIYFGAMNHTKDRVNYQGKRYDFIGVDEATHFLWDEYSFLISRNRPGGPGTRIYMRATTNPGGVGHGWVKGRFVTAAKPMTTIWDQRKIQRPDGTQETVASSRIFVPATVFDNKVLMDNDPGYVRRLAMLPKKERDALLYGNWDSFDGQVFTEWTDDPDHYQDRRWTHVIDPFEIPSWWRVYRSFDWGFSAPFSVGWYAADEKGNLFRIAELYGGIDDTGKGIEMEAGRIAAEIRRLEGELPNLKGRKITGVADPAIFAKGGADVAAIMERPPHCVTWGRGKNERIAGKMQLHYRLAFSDKGFPAFQSFHTCKHFIRTIPNLVYSKLYVEDVDSKGEDHAYDECRYMLMEMPISARPNVKTLPPQFDPLNLWSDKIRAGNDPYKYYRL